MMLRRIDTPPDLARPDTGLVLFTCWRVEPGSETTVTDTIARTWTARRPDTFGLITHSLFLGEGDLLHVTQLTRVDTRPDIDTEAPFTAEITSRVPGIEVLGVMAALPYRSSERRADVPRPGRYTHATVTLADPSLDVQRKWVDAVLDTGTAVPPESGLIATHYYPTTDATRVLTLTEWTTAEAHQRATGEIDPTDAPGAPGTTEISANQYRFAFALVPETAEES